MDLENPCLGRLFSGPVGMFNGKLRLSSWLLASRMGGAVTLTRRHRRHRRRQEQTRILVHSFDVVDQVSLHARQSLGRDGKG
jgi:hypothetical protein